VIWQPDHDKAIAEWRAAKLTASETALRLFNRFGINVSRNAVIGRLHRLRLPKSVNQPKFGRPAMKAKPKAVRTAPHIPPGSSEAVVPMMVPLLALSPNGCRWPYGDRGYVFCNHTRYSDSSYCQEHYRASLREFAG
jgi:hypothetical protein